jgi:AraC-like DNA-binding protein
MQVELELLQLLLDDPKMGVAQAAVTLGITVRTLYNYCQKQLGMSPGRYIKLARLLRARMALLHADPACSSVTAIARICGFTQLGRFSVDYRQAFRETPTQTLRSDLHRDAQGRLVARSFSLLGLSRLPMLSGMFSVSEAAAAAIRAAYEQRGELAAAVELRRHFPGIESTAQAREYVRIIAGWKMLPKLPTALTQRRKGGSGTKKAPAGPGPKGRRRPRG